MTTNGYPKRVMPHWVEKIDAVLKFSFWVTVPMAVVTSFRICYTIPSIFSDSSIVRYTTNLDLGDEGFIVDHYKALDFKNETQWRIAWDFLFSQLLVFGIYPFFITIILGFFWVLFCRKENLNTCISMANIVNTIKNTITVAGIVGVIITAFSIWGFK